MKKKNYIEEQQQEEIGGFQNIISQQKEELVRLKQDNENKVDKIEKLTTYLINNNGELQTKIQELKTKTNDYDSLKERFDENVNEVQDLIEELTENEDQFAKYMNVNENEGDYSKVEITDNEVNEEQKNYAIETTQNGLDTYSDRFKCAKYVKEQFENKYGGN